MSQTLLPRAYLELTLFCKCTFKIKSNLNLQEWNQNVQLQFFIQANIIEGKNTKNLPRTTTFTK